MVEPRPFIYVSTDIETNGPHIGKNSILSLASAAFLPDKTIVSTFSINLTTLPDGEENAHTMAWWKQYPEAWQAARENCVEPLLGVKQYVQWLKALPGRPLFVGYPVVFDFSFVLYYLERFVGENPFHFNAIDLRSLAMGVLKAPFDKASKSAWPLMWLEAMPHTHVALDDAIEQGIAFCNMLKEL